MTGTPQRKLDANTAGHPVTGCPAVAVPEKDAASSLRPLRVWTFALAAIFALAAADMLTDEAVSRRITVVGMGVAATAVVTFLCALYGAARPFLFSLAIYLAFFWAWILVPAAGMEAWLFTQGLSAHSAYAAHGWMWTYAYCGLATAIALRLLLLRRSAHRP